MIFEIPVLVDKKPDWKTENPVPIDKNRNFAQEIRFLKNSFRLSPTFDTFHFCPLPNTV